MNTYTGLQLVFSHIKQLIQAISSWFNSLQWNDILDFMPLQLKAVVVACLAVILGLSTVGLIKKLSFLLG